MKTLENLWRNIFLKGIFLHFPRLWRNLNPMLVIAKKCKSMLSMFLQMQFNVPLRMRFIRNSSDSESWFFEFQILFCRPFPTSIYISSKREWFWTKYLFELFCSGQRDSVELQSCEKYIGNLLGFTENLDLK